MSESKTESRRNLISLLIYFIYYYFAFAVLQCTIYIANNFTSISHCVMPELYKISTRRIYRRGAFARVNRAYKDGIHVCAIIRANL